MRRLLAVLALGAVVSACSEQATAPKTNTPAIAANFMNNPDNGNPKIGRFGGSYWWIEWTDGRYDALHITGPTAHPNVCGTDQQFFTESQVVWPNQEEWWTSIVHSHDTGVLWVILRDRQTPGPCGGLALVAQGPASFRAIYTDVLSGWWGVENGRKNSWVETFQSEGDLTTPTGETVRYNGHLHLTIAPDNTTKDWQSQIILH